MPDECIVVGDHSALILASACSASYTVGGATPTKLPSCTATTPGSASASFKFTDISFASSVGGRSTLPKSILGKRISEEYWCLPATMSRAFTFGVDVPKTFHLSVGVKSTLPLISSVSFCPFVSSPNERERLDAA